jgi:hypothetical protein
LPTAVGKLTIGERRRRGARTKSLGKAPASNPKRREIPSEFKGRMTETQATSTNQPFWTFRFRIIDLFGAWWLGLGLWRLQGGNKVLVVAWTTV